MEPGVFPIQLGLGSFVAVNALRGCHLSIVEGFLEYSLAFDLLFFLEFSLIDDFLID